MKATLFLIILTGAGCNNNRPQIQIEAKPDTTTPVESLRNQDTIPVPAVEQYANERFREVTVEKIGEHKFLIRGKGQIFEASFSWIVEDGHEELKKGFQMTDAGAPDWGNFSFTVDVEKKRENSTLMLVLFESSPKDGSRQYELPVLLY